MLQKKSIIVANWKMHKTQYEVKNFLRLLIPELKGIQTQIWIAPSLTTLSFAVQQADTSGIWMGAQNMFYESQGAFTGEVSAGQVADTGARFVIVGHSERRRLFGETPTHMEKKIQLATQYQLVPIFCIGETMEERKSGQTKSVLKRQLTEVLKPEFDGVIAYEPIWAIGTGQNAPMEVIEETHTLCREIVIQVCTKGRQIPILYGGSVTPEIASSLGRVKEVDGALVGGASLDVNRFISIIKGYAQ